jgi:hypothetical protein
MNPKIAINVYPDKDVEAFIVRLQKRLGLSYSDIFKLALVEYLKKRGLLNEVDGHGVWEANRHKYPYSYMSNVS